MNVESTTDTYQSQCAAKLADYQKFCLTEYRIPHNISALIAATLIPCQPHKPLWMIVETDRHIFWQHLSAALELLKLPTVFSCSGMRDNGAISAARSSRNVQNWVEERDTYPRIGIDTMADTQKCWHGMHMYHPYWLVCRESIRVLCLSKLDKMPPENSEYELARHLKLVIDPHRHVFPAAIDLPEEVIKFVQILAKYNRELDIDSDHIYHSLALVPGAHAALYGRTTKSLVPADWDALHMVLKSSVKRWVRQLLKLFYDRVILAGVNSTGKETVRGVKGMPSAKDVHADCWPFYSIRNVQLALANLEAAGLLRVFRAAWDQKRHLPDSTKRYKVTQDGELMAKVIFDTDFDITVDLKEEIGKLEI